MIKVTMFQVIKLLEMTITSSINDSNDRLRLLDSFSKIFYKYYENLRKKERKKEISKRDVPAFLLVL